MKSLENINEINLETISPKNLYCLGVETYHYHLDIYETDYYYYVYYNGEFIKVPFDIFKQILNKFGYDIKEERDYYQVDIIETEWKNDYKDNFEIVKDRSFRDINDADWLKVIFKIKELNMKEINIENLELPIDIVKKIDFTKNIQLHIKVQNKPEEWRLGQAYFNYAEELYPEEANQLRGTKYDCFYNDERIPIFLEELNENLLKFKKTDKNIENTMEFEGKTFAVNGKSDEQFVNDKIISLRKMRDDYQNEINKVSENLKYLQDKRDNIQKEIDEEFLKQEHAYDLVGKYIQCVDEIYFVTGVERLFDSVKILSNWYCFPNGKLFYTYNGKGEPLKVISFESLNAILSGKDEEFKFISKEKALEIFNQIIEEINKTYEK